MQRLSVRNLGPIVKADVKFGDLTILVGPQATGKSIFLQMLKLVVDVPSIQQELRNYYIHWEEDLGTFLQAYLGEGMESIVSPESDVQVNGHSRSLDAFAKRQGNHQRTGERLFYIPAQRVLSMRDGITHPFSDYRFGDPFCLREFSDKLHGMVQSEFIKGTFFPQINRLKEALRGLVGKQIYGDLKLAKDAKGFQKRIVLETSDGTVLPYLVWSAGQREFTPLLLGFYWLLPPSAVQRRQGLNWAVIEEPEMGLHPDGVSATIALVLELLARGYRVCMSTHSPHVLDVVWALQFMKLHGGKPVDVQEMLGLRGRGAPDIAKAALDKTYRTYFFPRGGASMDISTLDPGDEHPEISGWGGLTGFSGQVSEIVSRVARRAERVA
ncbi:MAG TPA: ATP-binding protein [Gammaproteobacteria bacterium]|nr:ATP-binding protein [Gammaproteobacteria bacterium]